MVYRVYIYIVRQRDVDVDWECTRFVEVELDVLYIGEIGFSVKRTSFVHH